MALLTAQQISRYYEMFREVDVIFTKEVIHTLGLVTKNCYLKHVGQQIPCVIYSTSMSGAKIVANVKSDTFARLHGTKDLLSLRFSFQQPDKPDPLSFYVTAKIVGFSPYGKDNQELNFVSLTFPQRPSDDLISILGNLLETGVNSKKRKEERIIITVDSTQKLGLKSKDALVFIQNVPRKCIVRDLSFSGARLIIPGLAKFLLNKPAALQLEFEDIARQIRLLGTIIRIEPVADREDIAAIAMAFEEKVVPLPYKMRISEYLSATKQSSKSTAATGE